MERGETPPSLESNLHEPGIGDCACLEFVNNHDPGNTEFSRHVDRTHNPVESAAFQPPQEDSASSACMGLHSWLCGGRGSNPARARRGGPRPTGHRRSSVGKERMISSGETRASRFGSQVTELLSRDTNPAAYISADGDDFATDTQRDRPAKRSLMANGDHGADLKLQPSEIAKEILIPVSGLCENPKQTGDCHRRGTSAGRAIGRRYWRGKASGRHNRALA